MRFKMKVGWAILETVPDPMYMAKSKLRRSPKDKKSSPSRFNTIDEIMRCRV